MTNTLRTLKESIIYKDIVIPSCKCHKILTITQVIQQQLEWKHFWPRLLACDILISWTTQVRCSYRKRLLRVTIQTSCSPAVPERRTFNCRAQTIFSGLHWYTTHFIGSKFYFPPIYMKQRSFLWRKQKESDEMSLHFIRTQAQTNLFCDKLHKYLCKFLPSNVSFLSICEVSIKTYRLLTQKRQSKCSWNFYFL